MRFSKLKEDSRIWIWHSQKYGDQIRCQILSFSPETEFKYQSNIVCITCGRQNDLAVFFWHCRTSETFFANHDHTWDQKALISLQMSFLRSWYLRSTPFSLTWLQSSKCFHIAIHFLLMELWQWFSPYHIFSFNDDFCGDDFCGDDFYPAITCTLVVFFVTVTLTLLHTLCDDDFLW